MQPKQNVKLHTKLTLLEFYKPARTRRRQSCLG
jgi:hypothetical protein